ncbi:MAG TPA: hypothetical protein P5038_01325 [Candidatus Paceibacterota bacterium]|nr:hypothetical protein [Candidatus Paceibacterota bacterium]
MRRVPQPPVQPALRASEARNFWPGFIAGVAGCVLVLAGARHLTAVETVEGGNARETQLVKAFAMGGLRYPGDEAPPPPPPPSPDDPTGGVEALERWARQNSAASAALWKVRVDTRAKTPCPT